MMTLGELSMPTYLNNPLNNDMPIELAGIAERIRDNWGTEHVNFGPVGAQIGMSVTYLVDEYGSEYAWVEWQYASDEGIFVEIENETWGCLQGVRIYYNGV